MNVDIYFSERASERLANLAQEDRRPIEAALLEMADEWLVGQDPPLPLDHPFERIVGRHHLSLAYLEVEDGDEIDRVLWVANVFRTAPKRRILEIEPPELIIMICAALGPIAAAIALYQLFH